MPTLRLALCLLLTAASAAAQSDPLYPFALDHTGLQAQGVTAGDLDGDGYADIVSTQLSDGTLSILLGRGDLTFEPAVNFPSGTVVDAPRLVDLDADGRLDVVACSSLVGVLTWHSEGDGDLSPVVTHPAGSGTSWVAVGDADGDGDTDVFAANTDSDTFSLLRGDGAGGLAPAASFGVYHEPVCVAAADLDLDGDLDAVTANSGFPSTLTVRLGDGAGSFGPKNTMQADATEQFGCCFVEPEDVDADGHPDLVVSLSGGIQGHLDILHGLGGGSFGPPAAVPDSGGNAVVMLVDVDGDGRRDVLQAAGNVLLPAVGVRLADGAGGYGPVTESGVPFLITAIAAADFDGDARVDVVVTQNLANSVFALRGLSNGAFEVPATFDTFAEPQQLPVVLAATDMDRDGDADAVVVAQTYLGALERVAVLPWSGDGYDPPLISPIDATTAYNLQHAAVGDLNDDDAGDVVVTLSAPGAPANHALRTLLNDGSGRLAALPDLTFSSIPGLVALGDVDADGDLDAALLFKSSFNLRVALGDGQGAFTPAGLSLLSKLPTELHFTDLNVDGSADLVCSYFDEKAIEVQLASGAGGLLPALPIANVLIAPNALGAGDLDEDGLPDLAWSDGDSHGADVRIAVGAGAGAFIPQPFDALLDQGGIGMDVADLNLDGHLDLASSILMEGSVSILLGDGDGALTFDRRYFCNGRGDGPRIADLDLDGRPDLLGVNDYEPIAVSILLGIPPDPWDDLGHALPGAAGAPHLTGLGSLQAGEPVTLKISDAKPSGLATLVIGAGPLFAPFKGGTLVPQVTLPLFGLPLDAFGHLAASGPWYGGLPAGTETYFQAWIPDAGGPKGFAATNALRATSP